MNKNRNYLVHYGKKGQKWGVRNYQNYDGSLTPLGREHYGVGQGRRNTVANKASARSKRSPKEIERFAKETRDLAKKNPYVGPELLKLLADESRREDAPYVPKKGSIYDDMHSELEDGRKAIRKATQISQKFYNDEELHKKYQIKAADKYYEEYETENPDGGMTKKDFEDWYLYDDGDQGEHSSFRLYCDENNINYSKLEDEYIKANEQYRSACKKVVEKTLGENGNITIPGQTEIVFDKNGHITFREDGTIETRDRTVSDFVAEVLNDYAYFEMASEGRFSPFL